MIIKIGLSFPFSLFTIALLEDIIYPSIALEDRMDVMHVSDRWCLECSFKLLRNLDLVTCG